MQSLAKKYKTGTIIGIVAIALVALTVGIAFALGAIGSTSSSGHVATGANLSILSASISNSTNTQACSFSSSFWSCSMAHVAQGTNLTTHLLVENTGSGVGYAYSNSTMIQGASLGSLIDEYTILNPISINAGANATLKIIFVVLPSATVGQTVSYNSTIF
jgi:hypothetical protein